MKKLVLLLSLSLLASCDKPKPSPLQGNWAVDLQATTDKAKASGLSDFVAGQIRETYGGGLLEITSDTLIMRIDGIPNAITLNYKVVGEADGCYTLEISGAPERHKYCLEGKSLVVHDPSANITVVYSGR